MSSNQVPQKRHKSGFRGPSPDVGKATRFQPGNRANPGGRPKKLTNMLNELLDEKVEGDPKKRKYARLLVEAAVKRAVQKSDILMKEIFDRIEGKASMSDEDAARTSNAVSVIILDCPRPPRPTINIPPIKKVIPAPTE